MHTKLKGDIGELIVAQHLLEQGWHVAFPFGENLKYDLIVEKNNIFKRVQVKAVIPKNGVLNINCRSSNNWSVVSYTPEDFEVLAAVDLVARKVYFVPSTKIGRNLIKLRIAKAKNSQKLGIHYAEEFVDFA